MMTKNLTKKLVHTVNFYITNLGPRRSWSRWMGRLSRIRHPGLTRIALWIWNRFERLELEDSPAQCYASIHDCFTRPLKPGTRHIERNQDVLISPCDGILGAHGMIFDEQLLQIKGKPYALCDLVGEISPNHPWRNGYFVTVRIKSNMYHRFHAPLEGMLTQASYTPGDAWNVNTPALERVDRLFCRNERACLHFSASNGLEVALVPVAAIWVAGIRVHALLDTGWNQRPSITRLTSPRMFQKGEEMGWFEHGSSIVLIMPGNCQLAEGLKTGDRLWMGQALAVRQAQSP